MLFKHIQITVRFEKVIPNDTSILRIILEVMANEFHQTRDTQD